jgi:hypothetical protein
VDHTRGLTANLNIPANSNLYSKRPWGMNQVEGGHVLMKKNQNQNFSCQCPFKGTVQRDFLSPIFSLMESSQAPYSVFKDFLNLASNSVRYSRFLIDSPQSFIAESPYSPYCLLRRVVTLRIIFAGSHHLLELSA